MDFDGKKYILVVKLAYDKWVEIRAEPQLSQLIINIITTVK